MKNMDEILGMPTNSYIFKPCSDLAIPDCKVGIELELEDFVIESHQVNSLSSMWNVTRDDSLRGEHAWELKSKQPTMGQDIINSLGLVETHVETSTLPESFYTQSERTSLHVHIDIRDLNLKELRKFILTYCLYEHLLYGYCGKERDNNIYCWPYYKAELNCGIVSWLFQTEEEDFLKTIKHSMFTDEFLKYSGMNINSIKRFGSLEFRHHPGEYRKKRIVEWINILMSIKKFSKETHLGEFELVDCFGKDQASFVFEKFFPSLKEFWNISLAEEGKNTCIDILNYNKYISSFGVSVLPFVYCTRDNNPFLKKDHVDEANSMQQDTLVAFALHSAAPPLPKSLFTTLNPITDEVTF